MKIRVSSIATPLTHDIDTTQRIDVEEIDSFISICITAAKDALLANPPAGFSDFERDQLVQVIETLRSSHLSIRKLLKDERNPSGVDALVIARLQIETLYSFCFLARDYQNIRLLLKNSWKKKFVNFLLERAELLHLPRFENHYAVVAPTYLAQLRNVCFVTEAEQRTIEFEELGSPLPLGCEASPIPDFPSPARIIASNSPGSQKEMLRRLYPEYRFLCSFAHGDAEALLFRTVTDTRSPMRHLLSEEQTEDFFQRQVREQSLLYSALSAIQVATEVAAVCPTNVELMVKISSAWERLRCVHFLWLRVWEIRSKHVIPLINR